MRSNNKVFAFAAAILAAASLSFSGSYLYASSSCNSSGELYDCAVLNSSLTAAEKDEVCNCACSEVFGFMGECDTATGCCLCQV